MSEGVVVRKTESSFGVLYQLCADGVVWDTYAPWNGDPRPDWMDLGGDEVTSE